MNQPDQGTMQCPCCSSLHYQACCKPLHDKNTTALTAEQLMRSRYSAFYLKNSDYLIQTLHPDFRQPDDATVLQHTFDTTQWLGLKILKHRSANNQATVEFVAFYQDAEIEQLHEHSRFAKVGQQWLYQDGDMLSPLKLARNDNCFCGSGKKLKKCHAS